LAELQLRRGAIYLLGVYRFPHEQGVDAATKARPVLILQDDAENRNLHYPFVIVAPLTSRKVDAIYPEDVFLPQGTGNLPVPSKVLLGLTFAVTKESLGRWIGQVDDDQMAQVNAVLQRLLALG